VSGILGTKTPELVKAFYKEYEKEIQKVLFGLKIFFH
jgi:hypothetical protein